MLCHIDDILVFRKSPDEHVKHLEIVFDRLRSTNLIRHISICQFALERLKYLEHILSENGIEVNPSKMEVMKSYPRPTNDRQLKSVLVLCAYYRKFVKKYAKMAASRDSY